MFPFRVLGTVAKTIFDHFWNLVNSLVQGEIFSRTWFSGTDVNVNMKA